MLYGIKSCAFSWVKNSNNFAVSVCIITIFVLVCIVVNQKKKKNDNDIEAYFYFYLQFSRSSLSVCTNEKHYCVFLGTTKIIEKKTIQNMGRTTIWFIRAWQQWIFFFLMLFYFTSVFFFVLWLFASLFCVMFILYRLILRNGNVTTQLAVSSFLQRRKLVECLSTCIETRCALEYLPTVMILICIC